MWHVIILCIYIYIYIYMCVCVCVCVCVDIVCMQLACDKLVDKKFTLALCMSDLSNGRYLDDDDADAVCRMHDV